MRWSERSNCSPISRACAGVPASSASPRSVITKRCLVSAWASRIARSAARVSPPSLSASRSRCAMSYGLSLYTAPVIAQVGHGPIARKVMTLGLFPGVFGLPRATRAGDREKSRQSKKQLRHAKAKPGTRAIWPAEISCWSCGFGYGGSNPTRCCGLRPRIRAPGKISRRGAA